MQTILDVSNARHSIAIVGHCGMYDVTIIKNGMQWSCCHSELAVLLAWMLEQIGKM